MIDAAVGSMGLPEGVVGEVVLEVDVSSVYGVGVSEYCVVVVESEVVDFDSRLAPRAKSPQMVTTRTVAVIPMISPVRLLRGGVTGGVGKGCA
jgi:hypothetical protein